MTLLVLLKISASHNLMGMFFPTILMLASLPFWFIKKIPNVVFCIFSTLALFGLAALVFIASVTSDDVQSPGWLGGTFIVILLLVCNSFQYLMYIRYLNTKRCPKCHALGMQTLSKDIDTKISTYITTYKAEGGRHDGRTYDKIDELIRKHITYTLYCPKCGNICNWADETEDHLKRDERPKD